jgi:hypothetical protein
MNRVFKLTMVAAAVAGAAVGTLAFMKRRAVHEPTMLDYAGEHEAISDADLASTSTGAEAVEG